MKSWIHPVAALLVAASLLVSPVYAGEERESERDQTVGESGVTLGESGWMEQNGLFFRTDFSFTIDPFEKNERGQVYSDAIRVVNSNPFSVEVVLQGPAVTVNDPEISVLAEPVVTNLWEPSADKDIHMTLRRIDDPLEPEWVLSEGLQEEPYRFTLGPAKHGAVTLGNSGDPVSYPSNEAAFEIRGSVNPTPEEPWRAGDVTISLIFGMENVEELLDELPEDDETPPEDEPSVGYST